MKYLLLALSSVFFMSTAQSYEKEQSVKEIVSNQQVDELCAKKEYFSQKTMRQKLFEERKMREQQQAIDNPRELMVMTLYNVYHAAFRNMQAQ